MKSNKMRYLIIVLFVLFLSCKSTDKSVLYTTIIYQEDTTFVTKFFTIPYSSPVLINLYPVNFTFRAEVKKGDRSNSLVIFNVPYPRSDIYFKNVNLNIPQVLRVYAEDSSYADYTVLLITKP